MSGRVVPSWSGLVVAHCISREGIAHQRLGFISLYCIMVIIKCLIFFEDPNLGFYI